LNIAFGYGAEGMLYGESNPNNQFTQDPYRQFYLSLDVDLTKIKNVILRVDFNVPIDQNFIIQDFTRINRSRETIEKLHKNNCKIFFI